MGGHLWRVLAALVVGALAVTPSAPAATAVTRVKDINPGGANSNPSELANDAAHALLQCQGPKPRPGALKGDPLASSSVARGEAAAGYVVRAAKTKNLRLAGLPGCRRQDSNLRHADYDR